MASWTLNKTNASGSRTEGSTKSYDPYPWNTKTQVSQDYIASPCKTLEEHDQSVVKLPWFFFEICDAHMMQKCLLLMLLLTTGWEN